MQTGCWLHAFCTYIHGARLKETDSRSFGKFLNCFESTCLTLHSRKLQSLWCSFTFFPTWLAMCTFWECKARYVVSKPLKKNMHWVYTKRVLGLLLQICVWIRSKGPSLSWNKCSKGWWGWAGIYSEFNCTYIRSGYTPNLTVLTYVVAGVYCTHAPAEPAPTRLAVMSRPFFSLFAVHTEWTILWYRPTTSFPCLPRVLGCVRQRGFLECAGGCSRHPHAQWWHDFSDKQAASVPRCAHCNHSHSWPDDVAGWSQEAQKESVAYAGQVMHYLEVCEVLFKFFLLYQLNTHVHTHAHIHIHTHTHTHTHTLFYTCHMVDVFEWNGSEWAVLHWCRNYY